MIYVEIYHANLFMIILLFYSLEVKVDKSHNLSSANIGKQNWGTLEKVLNLKH